MALNILNGGRLKAGSGGTGGAENSLNRAIQYTKERKQFGKSISDFGAIQYKIGNIAMQIFAVEAAAFRIADLIDKKEAEFYQMAHLTTKQKLMLFVNLLSKQLL